jgi:cytochrome b6-f complex iron-sulfur subunit
MAGSAGATIAFMYPRFKEGQFGGKFAMGHVDDFEDGSVTASREGKFFLVRDGDDFVALYQVCTHLGCLLRETPDGYACPCHGSKYDEAGTLVASPAQVSVTLSCLVTTPHDVIEGKEQKEWRKTGKRNSPWAQGLASGPTST